MPKFMCAVYLAQDKLRTVSDAECADYGKGLRAEGRLLAAESLQPPSSAKTVRVRNRAVSVVDGPFAETKELLAGFYLIEAEDIDAAVAAAARIPPARVGSVEVRQVRELEVAQS